MSDEAVPTPAPKTPARRADQDQAIANFITEARQMIESARNDAAIASILAGRGYDAAAFAGGLERQEIAQEAFTTRQAAKAAQKQASAAAEAALAAARTTYMDFRDIARVTFSDTAARAGLGLTSKIPGDVQKFITTARASYTAAQSAPYQATLATYGFPVATIASALTALDTLSAADQAQNAAVAAAVKATSDRDAAVKALQQWVKQFKAIASVALRAQPEQAKKLGL